MRPETTEESCFLLGLRGGHGRVAGEAYPSYYSSLPWDLREMLTVLADRGDELWILSRGQAGNLHDLFERDSNWLRMLFWPEDIVVTPR